MRKAAMPDGAMPAATPARPAHPPRLDTTLPVRSLMLVSVGLAVTLAFAELARLSGSQLDSTGRAWSFADLMGPGAWSARAGWRAAFDPAGAHVRAQLLATHLVLDAGFILLYGWGLFAYLRRHFVDSRPRRRRYRLLLLLLLADLLEDVLVLSWGFARNGLASAPMERWQAATLSIVSVTKCATAVAVIAVVIGSWLTGAGRTVRSSVRAAWELARRHRLSIVPVALIGALGLVPLPDILDQLPDVQRRWVDGPVEFFGEGVPAMVVLALLAGSMFALGRARTAMAARNWLGVPPSDPERARLWPWIVAPLALAATGGVLAACGMTVYWSILALATLPALLIFGTSLALRLLGHPPPARPPRRHTIRQLAVILRTGDVIAAALVIVAAVAAVRSVVPILLLNGLGTSDHRRVNGWAVLLLVVGVAALLATWPALAWLTRRIAVAAPTSWWHRWQPVPGQSSPFLTRTLPRAGLIFSIVLFLALGSLPDLVARRGVLVVFNLSSLAFVGLVSCVALLSQRQRPAEAFVWLRLRSTPVVSLFLLIVVLSGTASVFNPIHRVRSASEVPSSAPDPRLNLPTTIRNWAKERAADQDCRRTVSAGGRDVDVMPMVFVAAEGGGIRAAYWAVQVVTAISDGDACARHSVVLSSGVSGGAVGLAVLRFANDPRRVVTAMANSRALSYGLDGVFVRDFLYGAAGLPLPRLDGSAGAFDWVDRAALMEDAWNDPGGLTDAGWQGRTFLPYAGTGPRNPEPGSIVLNSMSVGNACRAWVSEVWLRSPGDPPSPADDDKLDCQSTGVSGDRSIDLLSAYGSVGASGRGPGCLYDISVATAALLAARFPYVTPSGQVGVCGRRDGLAPADQLVDGGYLENTGLGTVIDLADTWLPEVQRWNAEQLRMAHPKLVVPMVVYLDNDTGNDQNTPKRDITNESVLPPLAKSRANATGDELSLQRAADLLDPTRVCPLGGAGTAVCRAVVAGERHRVFMVYPASAPQIAAPLGWILSRTSREAMDAAVRAQASAGCGQTAADVASVVCSRGYGTLRDLQDAVRR